MIVGFDNSGLVREVKKEETVVQDLDNVPTCSSFLVVARSILEDVASACLLYTSDAADE